MEALRERRANALTVTSSEGLDNLCALLGDEGAAPRLRRPRFAPHPRIVEHAPRTGLARWRRPAPATPASSPAC